MNTVKKIYVASSWRNNIQQIVVDYLRKCTYDVYDFKNPEEGNTGFQWSEIDPNWQSWDFGEYQQGLWHKLAEKGFQLDWNAMVGCDACVLVLDSGKSSHLEAGYFVGANKCLVIYIPPGVDVEPELMYKMAGDDNLTNSIPEITELIENWDPETPKVAE